MKEPRTVEELKLLFADAEGQGMTLELYEKIQDGVPTANEQHLATIIADENETQWIEIYSDDVPVRFPIAALLKAVEIASTDVHSEGYYDGF